MRKLINFIKAKILLTAFLLWHDKQTKPTTKWIILTSVGLLGTLWSFPLGNITSSGVMPPELQRTLRIKGTCLLLSICLSLLTGLIWLRFKKYKQPHKLTAGELNDFLYYMDESSK